MRESSIPEHVSNRFMRSSSAGVFHFWTCLQQLHVLCTSTLPSLGLKHFWQLNFGCIKFPKKIYWWIFRWPARSGSTLEITSCKKTLYRWLLISQITFVHKAWCTHLLPLFIHHSIWQEIFNLTSFVRSDIQFDIHYLNFQKLIVKTENVNPLVSFNTLRCGHMIYIKSLLHLSTSVSRTLIHKCFIHMTRRWRRIHWDPSNYQLGSLLWFSELGISQIQTEQSIKVSFNIETVALQKSNNFHNAVDSEASSFFKYIRYVISFPLTHEFLQQKCPRLLDFKHRPPYRRCGVRYFRGNPVAVFPFSLIS